MEQHITAGYQQQRKGERVCRLPIYPIEITRGVVMAKYAVSRAFSAGLASSPFQSPLLQTGPSTKARFTEKTV
jgi:hypothetical protein